MHSVHFHLQCVGECVDPSVPAIFAPLLEDRSDREQAICAADSQPVAASLVTAALTANSKEVACKATVAFSSETRHNRSRTRCRSRSWAVERLSCLCVLSCLVCCNKGRCLLTPFSHRELCNLATVNSCSLMELTLTHTHSCSCCCNSWLSNTHQSMVCLWLV